MLKQFVCKNLRVPAYAGNVLWQHKTFAPTTLSSAMTVEENVFEVICTLYILSLLLTAVITQISLCRAINDLVTNITKC